MTDDWRRVDDEVLLTGACYNCGIPADEMPDSLEHWLVQLVPIPYITDPIRQGITRCPNDPHCPGHPVEQRLYCVACREAGNVPKGGELPKEGD